MKRSQRNRIIYRRDLKKMASQTLKYTMVKKALPLPFLEEIPSQRFGTLGTSGYLYSRAINKHEFSEFAFFTHV